MPKKKRVKKPPNPNMSPVLKTPAETAAARQIEIDELLGPIKRVAFTASAKRPLEVVGVLGGFTLQPEHGVVFDCSNTSFTELVAVDGQTNEYKPVRFYHAGDTQESADLRASKQKVPPELMTSSPRDMVNQPWTYCDWDYGVSFILEDGTEMSNKDMAEVMYSLGYGWCSQSKEWGTRSDGRAAGRAYGDGTALARKNIQKSSGAA